MTGTGHGMGLAGSEITKGNDLINNMANLTTMPTNVETSDLKDFESWYAGYHGFASLIVCTFGIISNMFNIAVLTRKNMRTPTNCLLTGLAIADMLTMTSYVPFALHFRIVHNTSPALPNPKRDTFAWTAFLLFHANFAVTTHTAAIFLGVALSVFRFIYVRMSSSGVVMLGMQRAQMAVGIAYFCAVIFLIPNYMLHNIVVYTDPATNETGYTIDIKQAEFRNPGLDRVNFWIHAIVIKIIPCLLMTIFGICLVCTIQQTQRKGQRMRRIGSNRSQALRNRLREHSRTTRMLVVVLVLFLITEFPQGILASLSGIDPGFFANVYLPLGDLMDIVALINNSINFILYCSMSKSFRQAFICMVCQSVKTFTEDRSECTCNQYTHVELREVEVKDCTKETFASSH